MKVTKWNDTPYSYGSNPYCDVGVTVIPETVEEAKLLGLEVGAETFVGMNLVNRSNNRPTNGGSNPKFEKLEEFIGNVDIWEWAKEKREEYAPILSFRAV